MRWNLSDVIKSRKWTTSRCRNSEVSMEKGWEMRTYDVQKEKDEEKHTSGYKLGVARAVLQTMW